MKRFGETPPTFFPTDWEERRARCGAGMMVVYAPQCPYIADAIRSVQEAAAERNIEVQVVELTTAQQVQELAPSPYGVYNVVYDRELLTYQPYVRGGILELLHRRAG